MKSIIRYQDMPAVNVIIFGQSVKCNFSSILRLLNVKEIVLDNDMDVNNVLMKYPNEKENIFSSMKRAVSQNLKMYHVDGENWQDYSNVAIEVDDGIALTLSDSGVSDFQKASGGGHPAPPMIFAQKMIFGEIF